MPKRRVSLRLAENEVAVVAPKERWEHLILVYESYAEDPLYADSAEAWRNSAEWIREWIAKAEPKATEEEW